MTETYYLLKTTNDAFYVQAEPDLANLKRSNKFIFCSDYEHATEYGSYDYEDLKEVAEKYGFIVYKVTVTTEMEKL
ncbi:hypothetical protein [Ligilactobacillus saerimneri]|uniref:hypothetical protein n=1 Tax=Ligilactobacillus saerimneri TaxID=228229 RepID=UPI002941E0FD|nr:hypothetical protein [Ligilactobacillus saerimneri]